MNRESLHLGRIRSAEAREEPKSRHLRGEMIRQAKGLNSGWSFARSTNCCPLCKAPVVLAIPTPDGPEDLPALVTKGELRNCIRHAVFATCVACCYEIKYPAGSGPYVSTMAIIPD